MNWKEFINATPEVLAGEPVVKGTRLSVVFLLGLMAFGMKSCFNWHEATV